MLSKELLGIERIIVGFVFFFLLTTIFLNVIWVVKIALQSLKLFTQYKACKQAPLLHPVHSDVQYLSKQRKLYNIKTHLVKNILVICCSCVETMTILWVPITDFTIQRYVATHSETLHLLNQSCRIHHEWLVILFEPSLIIMFNFTLVYVFLLFFFLSIITRYIAVRYFLHPFRPILMRYILWLISQFIIIAICSTPTTLIFSSILFPLLALINWVVLVRDGRILSRVLKSNLRDIKLYSSNKIFYKQELSVYKFYRLFRIFLLISMFFLFLSLAYVYSFNIAEIFYEENCFLLFLRYHFKFIQITDIHFSNRFIYVFQNISDVLQNLFTLLYSLFISLPLWGISAIPIVQRVVRRCTDHEDLYRFNYDKLKQQPLLQK